MKNKYKENLSLGLSFPLKLQQLEEGKNVLGGRRNHSSVAGGSSKISTEQVLFAWGHRVLAAGAQGGDQGCPEEDPKTSGSSGVQHRRTRLGKEVKVPQIKKILDSSDHLLSPNSSSNIHPSPSLAGCRSSTRLPWPGTRAGRGRGQGRAEGVACRRAPGAPPRAAGRAQSRRLHGPPSRSDPDAEASGSHTERVREPLAVAPRGEALISDGEGSEFELKQGSPRQSGSPREVGRGDLDGRSKLANRVLLRVSSSP